MPLFRLGPEPMFPPPELAEPEGLLAIGGDLSAERLLAAYRSGIFPWFEPGGPILWWSPDPRLVLLPESCGSRAGSPGRSARVASRPATIPPSPTSSGPAPRLLASTRTGPGSPRRCSEPTSASTSSATPTAWRAGGTGGSWAESTGSGSAGSSAASRCSTTRPTPPRSPWRPWSSGCKLEGVDLDRLPGRERAPDQPGGS